MISWVALKTLPVYRAEFRAERRIMQSKFPAMLPYEVVYEKRKGNSVPRPSRVALFSRYVFAGLQNIEDDFARLRNGVPELGIPGIPEIQGIVCRSRDMWSPLLLPASDVKFICGLVERTAGATEVNIHKSLAVGRNVWVGIGGTTQESTIDAISKDKVRVMLQMFNGFHSVEVPFDAVRAA